MRRLVLVIVSLSLLVGCVAQSEDAAAPTNSIVYGLTLSVSGIDPHINQSSELGIVLRQVYDTLVYRDPQTKAFVPGLASSWTVSSDGLTYTFNLRDDVTFHDGEKFNAQAVVANFDRILAPQTNSQRAKFLLGDIESYTASGTHTFTLRLRTPYSALLDGLSQVYLGIASPKALEAYKDDIMRYQYHQVGTGPFRFVEYLPEERIVLRRNPDYAWKPSFYGELPENAVDEVVFRFFRDPATRLSALETNTAQIMGELLPTDARLASSNSRLQLIPVPIAGQPLQFYFNTRLDPTSDLRVRQALLYAANRTLIVESVFQGFSPQAWGALAQVTDYYSPSVVGTYAYNTLAAQQLLDQAGYADNDGDGVLDRSGRPLEIVVIQPPWGLLPQVTQLLQDQWQEVGVRVIVKPVTGFTALLEQVTQGEYHLVAFDSSGLDPALLTARFSSNSPTNWTGYSDPVLDNLLQAAQQTTDTARRAELYAQIQDIIAQQALTLPIRDYVNLNAAVREIQGLRFDAYGWFPILYGVSYNKQG